MHDAANITIGLIITSIIFFQMGREFERIYKRKNILHECPINPPCQRCVDTQEILDNPVIYTHIGKSSTI